MTYILDRDWRAYLRANKAARDEYAAHPTTTCEGTVTDRDGTKRPCVAARGKKDRLCRKCRADAAKKRKTP